MHAILIDKRNIDRLGTARRRLERANRDFNRNADVRAVDGFGAKDDILHIVVRHAEQLDRAEYAREAPAVVRVEQPPVRARQHLDGDCVAPLDELVGDVPLCQVVGAAPASDVLAVHPHVVAEQHAVEAQDDALALPPLAPAEAPHIVAAHLVDLVAVLRRLQPLRLPVAGHGDVVPAGRVVAGAVPAREFGGRVEPVDQLERPRAVQRRREEAVALRVDLPRARVVGGGQVGAARGGGLARVVVHSFRPLGGRCGGGTS